MSETDKGPHSQKNVNREQDQTNLEQQMGEIRHCVDHLSVDIRCLDW